MFRAFVWGAVIGVLVAVVLSLVLDVVLRFILRETARFLQQYYVKLAEVLEGDLNVGFFVLVVLVAPFAEELAKGLGVFRVRAHLNELEDGIVYGASAGLGFAATENLLYGAVAYALAISEGAVARDALGASLSVIGVRSFSSVLLHASATSAFGYGVARSLLSPQRRSIVPFYLLAVFMHGAFNFFAGFGELFAGRYGEGATLIGLVAAIAIAVLAVGIARSAITRQEKEMAA